MRDNLEEAERPRPGQLPGAAGRERLVHTYVKATASSTSRVFCCRDAFAGLVMDQLRLAREQVEPQKGRAGPGVAPTRPRWPAPAPPGTDELARSDVATDVPIAHRPVPGRARVVKGIPESATWCRT